MLLIDIISRGPPIEGLELELEDVPRDQLDRIPDDMKAGKSFFRMQDRLLGEWFHVCKQIARSAVRIQNNAKGEGYETARPEICPLLLDELGFEHHEKVKLCRSVDRFYAELYQMRCKGRCLPQLEATVRVPSVSD